jgi:hypothetical protein
MKIGVVIAMAVFTMAGSAQPGMASGGIDFSAKVDCRRMFGHTTYYISFTEFDPVYGVNVKGESELEFPLDVFMAGIDVAVGGELEKGKPWSIILGFRKEINDPGNDMKDSDWIGVPEMGIREKFSYTESDSELDALILHINGRIGFFVHPRFTLEGVLGYRYQKFSYEIFGVSGWQLDEELNRFYFNEYQGVNVLGYQVSYHLPYLGLATRIDASSTFTIDAELAFSPLTLATDRDDHILRNRLAEGSCRGISFTFGLNAIWTFTRPESRMGWYVGIGFEFMKITTDGDQDQSWYGDDPLTLDDDTGLRYTGINQEINSGNQSILFLLGCQY